MGENIRISTSSIERDGRRLSELNESIRVLVDELETSMKTLSTCWEGPAWSYYQDSIKHSLEELTQIYNYMGKYSGAMIQSSQDYKRIEQDVCADI